MGGRVGGGKRGKGEELWGVKKGGKIPVGL